jgi:hypothetical protein
VAQTWTFRASVFNASHGGNAAANCRMEAAACAGPRGVTLAISVNSSVSAVSVYKSLDGGGSWTLVNDSVISWGGEMCLVWGGGTNWYLVATGGQYAYSTNDGTTWTQSGTGSMASQCNNSGAYDGSNAVVFQGVSSGQTEWLAASSSSQTVNNGALPTGSLGNASGIGTMVWDGTNFVIINNDTPGTSYKVLTAPTGFAQGAGPSWTLQQTLAIGTNSLPAVSSTGHALAFVNGVGYLTSYAGGGAHNGVFLATTYAGLLTSGALQSPLGTTTGYNACFGLNNIFLIGNASGGLAESPDGVTWTVDAPNFAVAGENLAQAVYDSTHNTYIIFGTAGSVCLGQVQAPFGRGLSPASPGVILSPNPNNVAGANMAQQYVNGFPVTTFNQANPTSTLKGYGNVPVFNLSAPAAGVGGDKWGAYGGDQTPIGAGVTGTKGYDRPIAVTVADGERAENYIVVGGTQTQDPPKTVLGAQANAALDAHTADSSLPSGDNTLGTIG